MSSKSAPCSPLKPLLPKRSNSFHIIHKVPLGDTPYVKAKHVQLVDKDPTRAIALFWAAINAGDRVDSALKDMAIVMKQQNRPEEAIEAIKSLRYRCSDQAQESLDNVLLDLYKRCGRLDDQIALLKHKLHLIHQGLAFNGRRTKTARSQGKKFQVSIEQEATRLLGNLGWAYMQQPNYVAAEAVYRKALSIEPDNNKVCNLGICLMKQGRLKEAKALLKSVKPASTDGPWGSDSHLKSYERAQEMLKELENWTDSAKNCSDSGGIVSESLPLPENLDVWQQQTTASSSWRWNQNHPLTDSDMSGALFATAGFGPAQKPPLPPLQPQRSLPILQENDAKSMKFSCKWEEEDVQQGFGDENLAGIKQKCDEQSMKWHAEALRQGLEKALNEQQQGPILRGNGILNSAAPPYVAKSSQILSKDSQSVQVSSKVSVFDRQERVPLTMDSANHQGRMSKSASSSPGIAIPAEKKMDRGDSIAFSVLNSSSIIAKNNNLGSNFSAPSPPNSKNHFIIDDSNMGSSDFAAKSSPMMERIINTPNSIKKKSCCKSLFAGENKNLELPSLSWGSLGFTQVPSPIAIANNLLTEEDAVLRGPKGSISALLLPPQDKCQRRLQVFQEMTLPASPQA